MGWGWSCPFAIPFRLFLMPYTCGRLFVRYENEDDGLQGKSDIGFVNWLSVGRDAAVLQLTLNLSRRSSCETDVYLWKGKQRERDDLLYIVFIHTKTGERISIYRFITINCNRHHIPFVQYITRPLNTIRPSIMNPSSLFMSAECWKLNAECWMLVIADGQRFRVIR